jgi:hypothetical protein
MVRMFNHHLPKQLSFRESFLFPIESPEGRRDVLIGGLVVIFLLPIGWILNLGARLDVVHRLFSGERPYFRGMRPWRHTFRRGCVSAATILCYLLPANLCFGLALWLTVRDFALPYVWIFALVGLIFFILGVYTLPGCMTVYACEEDSAVLREPIRAFQRAWEHRHLYFKAWIIAITSILISFFGLLFFGTGRKMGAPCSVNSSDRAEYVTI